MNKLIVILLICFPSVIVGNLPQPCDDDIYCYGDILHTVQLAVPFEDRKTYVDLPLKLPRQTIKNNFKEMMSNTSGSPSVTDIRNFLSVNFGERGTELETWDPSDWKPYPNFISYINDPLLQEFAIELNALWKQLGKRIKSSVKDNPDMFSLFYLPNPVILPGGRFMELYYWDTYWIIRGLIHCEMYESVKGMLEDFLLLVDTYGYVPNGNRIYYTRTQPPFLIQMFNDYIEATGDLEFLEKSMPSLESEYEFWMDNRSVVVPHKQTGNNYTMFRYINERTGPRPEGYAREYLLAQTLESTQQQDEFYMNIKSGAESGWDFSTRWFSLNASANSTLLETKTSLVIPVDLNAIMLKNSRTLSRFNKLLGRRDAAKVYHQEAYYLTEAISNVLWDDAAGSWFDYDLEENALRKKFYPSNIFPLWAGITLNSSDRIEVGEKVVKYLENSGALGWDGGIPTSLENSGQQWDFPNAWPPLQHLFIESLDALENDNAKLIALDTAQKWVANNYLTYKRYNDTMFEKYRADVPGEPGGGGLYDVVVGFGWTNGVILDLLEKYGDKLSAMYNDVYHWTM